YADGGRDIIGQNKPTTPVKPIASGEHNYLGHSNWWEDAKPGSNADLNGEMDEVRVWKVARTAEQIRENMLKQFTGGERGLVALWNCAAPANPGRDASPNHHDGKLIGNARAGVPSATAGVSELAAAGSAAVTAISGRVTDSAGKPLGGVEVRLIRGGRAVGTARSGEDGYYFLLFNGNAATCRLTASSENLE